MPTQVTHTTDVSSGDYATNDGSVTLFTTDTVYTGREGGLLTTVHELGDGRVVERQGWYFIKQDGNDWRVEFVAIQASNFSGSLEIEAREGNLLPGRWDTDDDALDAALALAARDYVTGRRNAGIGIPFTTAGEVNSDFVGEK